MKLDAVVHDLDQYGKIVMIGTQSDTPVYQLTVWRDLAGAVTYWSTLKEARFMLEQWKDDIGVTA